MGSTRPLSLPDSDVVLKLMSQKPGDDFLVRIESVFIRLWSQIHSKDRLKIATYWAKDSMQIRPAILFEIPWFGDEGSLGTTEERGSFIRLNWSTIRSFEDPSVADRFIECVLAHEMAHVFQFAIGKGRSSLTDDDLTGSIKFPPELIDEGGRVEIHADETMLRWGFDPLECLILLHQYTKTQKDGTVTCDRGRHCRLESTILSNRGIGHELLIRAVVHSASRGPETAPSNLARAS